MADIEKTIKIQAEIGDTQTKLEAIERQLAILTEENEKLAASGKETDRSFQNNSRTIKELTADIEKKNQKLQELNGKLNSAKGSTDRLTVSTDKNKKSVLENGGAMGLLGAATGGMAMDFKDGIEAVEGLGISMKGLRGAIIATGIGALAIVILELVTNWEKWSGVIDGSTKKLEANERALKQLNNEIGRYNSQTQFEIDLAEQRGASDEQLYNARIKQIIGLIELKKQEKQALEETYRLELSRDRDSKEAEDARLARNAKSLEIQQLEQQAILLNAKFRNSEADERKKQEEEAAKLRQKAIEEERARQFAAWEAGLAAEKEFYKRRKELAEQFSKEEAEAREKSVQDEVDILTKLILEKDKFESTDNERALRAIENERISAEAKLNELGISEERKAELLSVFDLKRKEVLTKQAEDEALIEENKNRVIAQSQQTLFNIINNLEQAGLAKSKAGQAVQKTLALTQIGVDSAVALGNATKLANAEGVAAQLAFPTVPGAGTIARITSYASTAAQVISNIARARTLLSSGGKSGGGGGNPGNNNTNTVPSPQASFNIVGQSSTNQLAATIGAQQNQPVQAYVVGSEVSTQQSLDRNRVQSSTFL